MLKCLFSLERSLQTVPYGCWQLRRPRRSDRAKTSGRESTYALEETQRPCRPTFCNRQRRTNQSPEKDLLTSFIQTLSTPGPHTAPVTLKALTSVSPRASFLLPIGRLVSASVSKRDGRKTTAHLAHLKYTPFPYTSGGRASMRVNVTLELEVEAEMKEATARNWHARDVAAETLFIAHHHHHHKTTLISLPPPRRHHKTPLSARLETTTTSRWKSEGKRRGDTSQHFFL